MSPFTRGASRTHGYRRASSGSPSRSIRVDSDRSCIAWRRRTSYRRMPLRDGHPRAPTAETPVLWHLEISHYNEKARWALDYKGIAHQRRAVTPGLQELTARRLRAGRTVPILELDGRAIGDSTKIIEETESRWPEPPLYPAHPEQRTRALDLEDYFDEQCGPDARRVLFNDNLTDPETFIAMFIGAERRRTGLLEMLTPLFCRL